MDAINRLYKKDNKKVQKCVNIDDELYKAIKTLTKKEFDASVSEIVNVCLENYISKNNTSYYAKPDNELSMNRSLMLRKKNIDGLKKMQKSTGISFTRLLNGAIKDFIDNI